MYIYLDIFFKFLPLRFLKIFSPFNVTRKNLSIAFENITPLEIDLLAKESYKESIKGDTQEPQNETSKQP